MSTKLDIFLISDSKTSTIISYTKFVRPTPPTSLNPHNGQKSAANNFDSSVAMSQDNESNIIGPILNSTTYSTATESSVQHHDSELLTGEQLNYPLHSTELPTIVKMDNLAKDLRDMGRMQGECGCFSLSY